ncbi:HNH endonuclease family protein [Streptosporangium saharense]|uniref:HNH endonuclease family protein n=1 Tax=Streptosporangium saharense TaxID=1706840 RepID=UPI00343B5271
MTWTRRSAAVLPLLLALAPAAHAEAAPSAHAPAPLLREAIATLPVVAEDRTGYKRSSFRHWIDTDHDGCSTRDEVLIEEAATAPEIGPGCALTGGRWYSYYDDTIVSEARALDVDHLVPLAEAWDSGASTWTTARRQDYANYLGDSVHLVAVTARTNRQKADKDPAAWLPPYQPARCRYVTEWTAVKVRWALSIDTAERDALAALAADCPNVPLPSTDDDRP